MLWIGWFVLPYVAQAAVGREDAHLSEDSISLDDLVALEAVDLTKENGKADADKASQFLRVADGSNPQPSDFTHFPSAVGNIAHNGGHQPGSGLPNSAPNPPLANSVHGSPYNALSTGNYGGSGVNATPLTGPGSHHYPMQNTSTLLVKNPGVCCCPDPATNTDANPRIGCGNVYSGSMPNATFRHGFDRHGCVDGNLVKATQHSSKPYSRASISCTGTCLANGTSASQCTASNSVYSFTLDEWNNWGHASTATSSAR